VPSLCLAQIPGLQGRAYSVINALSFKIKKLKRKWQMLSDNYLKAGPFNINKNGY
jgi:hypothetical protein